MGAHVVLEESREDFWYSTAAVMLRAVSIYTISSCDVRGTSRNMRINCVVWKVEKREVVNEAVGR